MDELSTIAEFVSGLKVEEREDEDSTVHPEIQGWYKERIKECIQLGMTDVALAYHAQISRDKRLSPVEATRLLLETMSLF